MTDECIFMQTVVFAASLYSVGIFVLNPVAGELWLSFCGLGYTQNSRHWKVQHKQISGNMLLKDVITQIIIIWNSFLAIPLLLIY